MQKFKSREFEIFGSRYTLEYPDVIESDREDMFTTGRTNSAANKVLVAKLDYEGNIISKDEHKIILLHELLHAILDEGLYLSCSSDEPLVEWLARCLKSLMDLKVI